MSGTMLMILVNWLLTSLETWDLRPTPSPGLP